MPHPSYLTLLPVLGTMLLIRFASFGTYTSSLLSFKPLVGLGLISYGFYLWHFPFLAFARVHYTNLGNRRAGLLICASLVLSVITYFLIEKPARNKKLKYSKLLVILSLCLAALTSAGVYLYSSGGAPNRLPFSTKLFDSFEVSNLKEICGVKNEAELLEKKSFCKIGDPNSRPSFILIGDSHAHSLLNLLHNLGLKNSKAGLFKYASGCPPLFGVYPNRNDFQKKYCFDMNNQAFELTRVHRVQNIFLVARWNYYTDGSSLQMLSNQSSPKSWSLNETRAVLSKQITYTLAEFIKTDTHPVILMQVPHQKGEPMRFYQEMFKELLNQSGKGSVAENLIKSKSVSLAEHNKRQELTSSIIYQASKKFGNKVTVLNPIPTLCDDEVCPFGSSQETFYNDPDHLSIGGADTLESLFKDFF